MKTFNVVKNVVSTKSFPVSILIFKDLVPLWIYFLRENFTEIKFYSNLREKMK